MCFGINIFYLFPLSSGIIDLLTYINIGIGTVLVILFLSISFSNPGILKAKDDLNFIKLLRAYNPKRICYDCSVPRIKFRLYGLLDRDIVLSARSAFVCTITTVHG